MAHTYTTATLLTATMLTLRLPAAKPEPAALFAVAPRTWAEQAATNEINILQSSSVFLRYQAHVVNARGDQLRDVIESRDGAVARLIQKDERSLTPAEDEAERERLRSMKNFPSEFARHIKADRDAQRRAVDIIRLMPAAMIYTYAPGQPSSGHPGPHPPEVVLDFTPDPAWSPPNLTAQALTGFAGRLWIDSASHNVVRVDGNIVRGINFGFGMLARIYPGGQISLEQLQAAPGRWIVVHFIDHVTLRAILVRTIRENNESTGSNFRVVPAMSYTDAIDALLNTPLPH